MRSTNPQLFQSSPQTVEATPANDADGSDGQAQFSRYFLIRTGRQFEEKLFDEMAATRAEFAESVPQILVSLNFVNQRFRNLILSA